MRDDLSPFGQGVLAVGGWVFCMMGTLAQCVGLFGTFIAGMAMALGFAWIESLKVAAALFVVHAFGALMLEFGSVFLRGGLPVSSEQLAGWFFGRLLWRWLAAIFIPAAVATLLAVWKLEWTAFPAAAVTVGCYFGIRFLAGRTKASPS